MTQTAELTEDELVEAIVDYLESRGIPAGAYYEAVAIELRAETVLITWET